VSRSLAWNRPDTWVRAAWRLRDRDAVVFVVVTPIQLIAYHVMLTVLGRRVRTVALVHNVLPHEPSPLDRPLVAAFLRRVSTVLVHSDEQATLARSLAPTDVRTEVLPSNIDLRPARHAARRTVATDRLEVLFFGLVRPYKGVDLLVRAAGRVPQVHLTIAGEFWVDEQELLELAESVGLADRLTLVPGYVPADQLAELFGACHIVALPYRHATGSGNIRLALEQGVPVIVTRVGDLPDAVAGGVGLVCEPDDAESLGAALARAADVAVLAELDRAVLTRPSQHEAEWVAYATAVIERAGLG
jgi:glycosyltransferase involved in cell wall biosynthesis